MLTRTLTVVALATILLSASAGWVLEFSDDFNAPDGSGVDGSKWSVETGGWGFGNNEREMYTSNRDNVAIHRDGGAEDGSALFLTAIRQNVGGCWYGECQYTSGKITTQGHYAREMGTIQARIRIPQGQGMWPAFWLLGNDINQVGWPACGEIDIMEILGNDPYTLHTTAHGSGYSGAGGKTAAFNKGVNFADGYHVYSVEWNNQFIAWSVDGQEVHRLTSNEVPQWNFNKQFFILLNLAVGGNWPGDPNGSTPFPQSMAVDWVRSYYWA